jgi:cytochrome c-type biogenesis protein CcmF
MVAHPPFIYLGYVGVTIPFAFAIGSLLARRADEAWIIATRKWTLAAWLFLGIGQLLGARWAYLEVGWGGYYGWDPVENAALMPWLAATAFLHSVMVQEKKGMLRIWNMILVVATFTLALFGTFLTRSGVISSIHAFAQGPIGVWFLAFIVLVLVFSTWLVVSRLPLLRTRTRLESIVSREATFLYNNLLLVALTLTILWGVIYPMLSELVRGESRIMGAGYYNFFLRVFGLPLLLLMGIAPLIAWRRASLRTLRRTFAIPFAAAVVTGAALVAAGAGSSPVGLVAYTFSAFVAAAIVLEFARGTIAQQRLTGTPWLRSFGALIERNRRRYGGYIVHVAIVLLAVGVTGSSLYQDVSEARLAEGQSLTIGDYALRHAGVTERLRPGVAELRAQIDVVEDGAVVGRLTPGKNGYTVEAFFSKEVATRTNWLTGEDLYLIVEEVNADGSIYLRAFVKPLVNLLWFAGAIFIFGSLVALWPDAREARRVVARRTAALVPEGR